MALMNQQLHRSDASVRQSPTRLLVVYLSGLLFVFSSLAHAQPPPITSSELNTQVSPPLTLPTGQTQYDITGGTRPDGGVNLFHSFGDFNVPNNNIANFLNDSGLATSNILGRVTEGNISNIFGTIRTTGFMGANLFLMNPAGFLFGPNATVNVGGMVAFTTADYLRLADGVRFNAIPDAAADALLSPAPVAAFGFLGSNPGAITVQGSQFTVTEGTGISLVGGNIAIESGTPDGGIAQPARLSAPNGKIQLASASSPGEFDATTLQALTNVDGALFTSFGSFSLAPGSNINVSGTNTVSIRGGQFVLSVNDAVLTTAESVGPQETISFNRGSSIVTSNSGAEPGADIQIIAGNFQMDGASIQSTTTGDRPGGNISITNTQTVNLSNGAQIVSNTTGAGDGGNITISATTTPTSSVTISGFDSDGTLSGVAPLGIVTSGVFSTTSGQGTGGKISIMAPTGTLDNGGTLASITSGDRRGGDITLNVGILNIQSGGLILSTAGSDLTTGNGRAGDITVTAQDSIRVSEFNPNFGFTGGILSLSNNAGDGGNIALSAPSVSIENGGVIQSSGTGTGNAGNIAIAADQVLVSGVDDFGNSSQISSTGSANSGTITITAQSVTVSDLGFIQTMGNGGNITIQAGQSVNVTGVGVINSVGGDTGPSGDITISADHVLVSGHNDLSQSRIETSGGGGPDVGKINLNVRELLVTDGARINTEASGANAIGGIHISATESATVSEEGKIRMSSLAGPAGPIEINAPTITLDQGVIQTESISGNAGSVTLHADNLTLAGGFINTKVMQDVPGRGGDVMVNVTDKVSISGRFNGNAVGDNPRPAGIYADIAGTLQGGDISVTAGNLISISGARVGLYSQTLGSSGNGGAIDVQAPQVQLSDGAIISAKTTGAGNAGSILVKADTFNMNGGSTITAASIGSGTAGGVTIEGLSSPAQSILINGAGSGIFTDTQGTGAGGNIFANANSVTLQNGGTLSAKTSGTAPTATGGSIAVTATNQVSMTGGSSISASSTGAANAGNITINPGNRFESRNSSVTTNSEHAGGGNVEINATDQIRLVNSLVNASAYLNGGNITIDPNLVILQNSQILARAVQGAGGNITITTPLFLADQTSLVSASSQFGLNGTVTIQSPTSNLSGSVGSLPSSISQQQALQAQRCAALSGGASSSFLIAGRDSIPTEPGGWLTRPLGLHSLGGGLRAETTIDEQQPSTLLMAQSSEAISLRRLTPAGFLTERFAGNGSDGCRS